MMVKVKELIGGQGESFYCAVVMVNNKRKSKVYVPITDITYRTPTPYIVSLVKLSDITNPDTKYITYYKNRVSALCRGKELLEYWKSGKLKFYLNRHEI